MRKSKSQPDLYPYLLHIDNQKFLDGKISRPSNYVEIEKSRDYLDLPVRMSYELVNLTHIKVFVFNAFLLIVQVFIIRSDYLSQASDYVVEVFRCIFNLTAISIVGFICAILINLILFTINVFESEEAKKERELQRPSTVHQVMYNGEVTIGTVVDVDVKTNKITYIYEHGWFNRQREGRYVSKLADQLQVGDTVVVLVHRTVSVLL